jgi:hypothetical protein
MLAFTAGLKTEAGTGLKAADLATATAGTAVAAALKAERACVATSAGKPLY